MESLFNRLTRYRVSAALDPRENRLTESFAAVLMRSEGLPHALVSDWLQREVPKDLSVHIRTQRATARGFFVDLEIEFRDRLGEVALVCWVENKHGAWEHGNQLTEYLRDVRIAAGEDREVILLAPRQSMPPAPPDVTSVDWQTVAQFLRSFRGACNDEVEAWLLDEFGHYLKEEGLVDADALATRHAMFLNVQPEALEVLRHLHELADEAVEQRWCPRSPDSGGGREIGFWSIYDLARGGERDPRWSDNDYLEWGLRRDERPDATGNVYCAGVTFYYRKNAPDRRGAKPEWFAARRAEGLEFIAINGSMRLWRFMRPEALLAVESAPEQARMLADFIVDTFETATAYPPEIADS